MLLDLGRNDVGRVAMLKHAGRNDPAAKGKQANVRVTDSFKIERYSHVMHIVSNVEGDAPDGVDPVDVLMAALPAGTLSGAPKVRAMEIIDELEIEKRGIGYAGAVGYIGADGSVDTCIVLRTALVKDGMMYVQAGGGVVADSDPDAEYDETLHKSRALKRAAEEAGVSLRAASVPSRPGGRTAGAGTTAGGASTITVAKVSALSAAKAAAARTGPIFCRRASACAAKPGHRPGRRVEGGISGVHGASMPDPMLKQCDAL
jgi:hypothetical protein